MLENRTFFAAAALAAAALLAGSGDAWAQRAGAQDDEQAADQQTRRTPTMSQRVYEQLTAAQACAEMDDWKCATDKLEQVRAMRNLTPYEMAQMWSFYAYVYFSQENYTEAIRAYENVLQQPDLPEATQISTLYSLAQLYAQQEDFQKALGYLDRWFQVAQNPNPDAYYLKAQLHYQLQQFREGLEPIQTAMRIARERGQQEQEGWYQLLNVLYFELEDYPNVIRTLGTMIERWPKRDYVLQLAGIYSQEGQDQNALALYEAVHSMGWLERGTELVTLAQMLLQAEIPYKAARILEQGLQNGTIDSTEQNWRLLAQAWQLAQEDEKALPALSRAASMANDGEIDVRLAQAYMNLARWEECAEAARTGIRKGDLNRADQANLILGTCLIKQKKWDEARQAIQAAARDERSRRAAEQWLSYINSEVEREREIAAALRRL